MALLPIKPAARMAIAQRMVDLIERSFPDRITLKSVSANIHGKPSALSRIFEAKVRVRIPAIHPALRGDARSHSQKGGCETQPSWRRQEDGDTLERPVQRHASGQSM